MTLTTIRARLSVLVAAAALSLAVAGTAQAQSQQDGLVNVIISDVTVQVPISVAANICDTNVAVLSDVAEQGGTACEAESGSTATWGQGGGGNGNAKQEGLVNVIVDDVTIQAPISVAANLCDTTVAVLSQTRERGRTQCTADATSLAS